MDLLWIATKPPWPPTDGGRLLLLHTLAAFAEAGAAVTLVAPFDPALQAAKDLTSALRGLCELHPVPAPPMRKTKALMLAGLRRMPLSVALQDRGPVRAEVARLLEARRFDLVQVEQIQAFAAAEPALQLGLPVVLRCQNVESDLWRSMAGIRPLLAPLLRLDARRLARYEAQAIRAAAAVIALTTQDADRLAQISGSTEIHRIAAPFPPELPSARSPLSGAPAVVVLGSQDWLPNRDGAEWFVRDVWPQVQAKLRGAVLHLLHGPALEDSRDAFPAADAVLAVPLRFASGVRMRILEAWARGVPVVATPAAAAGLDAKHGRELLLASTPEEFASAISTLHRRKEQAAGLVRAGRTALRMHHDPWRLAYQHLALYSKLKAEAEAR